MDRQEFSRLVTDKLSCLFPDSLNFSEEGDETVTIEVVSKEFQGKSVLKRINCVYSMIEDCIQEADFHVNIIPLTIEERENDPEFERSDAASSFQGTIGRAASTPTL